MPAPRPLGLALLSVFTVVLVAACGSSATATQAPSATTAPTAPPAGGPLELPAALAGRTFLSTAVTGHDLVAGSQVRLTFGNVLGASAGCNSMSGAFGIQDGTLHVAAMASTEMACDAPLMAQDAWLAGFIDGATVAFDGTALTLAKDGTTLTLVDEQIANPDRPLEGTTWTVDGLVRNQAVSSVPAGLTATLEFKDGRVSANTGCNRGNGTATVGETTITFGPMALTRMACPPPAMELEAFVTGVLEGEVAYSIDADVLHLLGAGGGLELRAQP